MASFVIAKGFPGVLNFFTSSTLMVLFSEQLRRKLSTRTCDEASMVSQQVSQIPKGWLPRATFSYPLSKVMDVPESLLIVEHTMLRSLQGCG